MSGLPSPTSKVVSGFEQLPRVKSWSWALKQQRVLRRGLWFLLPLRCMQGHVRAVTWGHAAAGAMLLRGLSSLSGLHSCLYQLDIWAQARVESHACIQGPTAAGQCSWSLLLMLLRARPMVDGQGRSLGTRWVLRDTLPWGPCRI